MTIAVGVKHKRTVAAARIASIDAGAGDSTFAMYAGARIAITDTPPAAVVTITLPRPCGVVTDAGVLLSMTLTAQAIGSGYIAWGRYFDGDGVAELDVDVRMIGDVDVDIADVIIDEAAVFAGAFVTIAPSTMNEAG